MKKEWYKSKTVWSGIVIGVVGLLKAFGVEVPIDTIVAIAGGFGLYGIRDAIKN